MNKNNKNEGSQPCHHMTDLLNRVADGSAKKWEVIYAKLHSKTCHGCNLFLSNILSLKLKLKEVRATEEIKDQPAIERIRATLVTSKDQVNPENYSN